MIPIFFAALCVAVAAAESSSVSSHSTAPSDTREYEYPSASYLASGKPNYSSDLSTAAYSGNSPYAKSDSRLYSAADSSSGSSSSDSASSNSESRASSPGLSGSYYKSKYGSDAAVNAIRPTAFHTGSSSSSPSSSSSSDIQYPGSEYSSNHAPSSNDYLSTNYGQREHHHAYQSEVQQQQQQPEYVGTRPTGTIYGTYAGAAEYPHSRPTAYSEYNPHHHPAHAMSHYPTAEDYPSPPQQPHYKTYIMSSAPSYPTGGGGGSSKYSTVLGAIKSLFGGGSGGPMLSDAASSGTHLTSYSPMGPSSAGYYSSGLMHPAHHMSGVSASSPAGVGAAPPSYYLGAGLAPSTSAYSKSYAPMRLMSSGGYGGNGAPGSKVIVVRDSGSAHLGASYPATAGLLMTSSTSYPVKSKISFGPPSSGGYIPSPSSLQSYTSGPPSSAFPTSYSSSSSFGGSPFLGYSI